MNEHLTKASAANSSPGEHAREAAAAKPAGRTFATQADMDAARVSELTLPGCLGAILGEGSVSSLGVKIAFGQFLQEAGATKDPVERVLLEQLIIAHHRLGKLQVAADAAKAAETVKAYNAAAVRLLGEVRRLALAIRLYRLPAGQKSFAVVHQQNLVSSGQQTVQYVAGAKGKETLIAHDKLNSTPTAEGDLHAFRERVANGQESEPGSRGKRELAAASGLDA